MGLGKASEMVELRLVLPGGARAGWLLPLALWHRAPGQLGKRARLRRWIPKGRKRGGGNSERMFWPSSEGVHISILVWKVFCPANLFLGVCTEIV